MRGYRSVGVITRRINLMNLEDFSLEDGVVIESSMINGKGKNGARA